MLYEVITQYTWTEAYNAMNPETIGFILHFISSSLLSVDFCKSQWIKPVLFFAFVIVFHYIPCFFSHALIRNQSFSVPPILISGQHTKGRTKVEKHPWRGSAQVFDILKRFEIFTVIIGHVIFAPRITSYNVCYTKLLRFILLLVSCGAMAQSFMMNPRITSYNVCYTKLLR